MPKVTVKSLQAEISALKVLAEEKADAVHRLGAERREAVEREERTRKQFDDLKFRLHNSEMEVSRLNGYLARVREDDVVREELVTVGDPEGGQRLVPKRKPEFLGNREPHMTMDFGHGEASYGGFRERPKPKHWIEY